MLELPCPKCKHPLQRSGQLKRHCERCNSDFTLLITCHHCGDEIERLKACGAVDFWCNNCNELKSKSAVIYTLKKD
ncbi:MAG: zinc ribbon domain-containing protein [Psychromonas sp.]